MRLALVALGLAAVLNGVASLTGGWLGFPPRYEAVIPPAPPEPERDGTIVYRAVVHDGGEGPGVALVVLGLALAGTVCECA